MSTPALKTIEENPKKDFAAALQKKLLNYVRYIISTVFTLTYLVYIMWGIWTGEAVLPGPPVFHFIVFCFCIVLVAYLEGLQVAILAVEHQDIEKKKEAYPRAYELMKSVKLGNNVERFLVGRQFFTIFVMTLIAQVTSFPLISQLGINPIIWFIFIQTGLPGAVVVTTIGSLQPQLLAARDPWKFMNLYGSCFVVYMCYGLEFTGICTHFAWMLISIFRRTVFVSDIAPRAPEKEPTMYDHAAEGLKYVLSCGFIGVYITYIMYGIWTGEAILPIPPVAVFLVFAFCINFLAQLEGLQVAILLSELKDPEAFAESHPRAYALMKRATHEKNVRRFLIGRQFFVIFVVFLINQCTIFPTISQFGVNSIVWFAFIQLGFPTALNVLCWAQLPAQLLANQDPYMFMNRYGPRTTLEVCLFTEMTGLAHFSWVISAFSMATWFRPASKIVEVIEFKNDVSKKGRGPNSVTADSTNNTNNGHYETEELQLEMHTDISHVIDGEVV